MSALDRAVWILDAPQAGLQGNDIVARFARIDDVRFTFGFEVE